MTWIRSDRILLPDGILDGWICLEADKIIAVTEEAPNSEAYLDFRGLYVSPGFLDLHTHGGGGNAFEGSVDDIVAGCNFHLRHGTTSICPTISAAPFDQMAESTARIAAAMQDERYRGTILGSHLEGPYLSRAQAGAQCADFITSPKEEEYLPLLHAHHDTIARWTYAPENDAENRFVRALKDHGVLPSAGHTDAIYDDMLRAESDGCRLVTHLYSCTSTITRDHGFRRLGVIESAYLSDDMYVEIICDGKHLPPELIRLIYRIKGRDRILLVTDSLALAGTSKRAGIMQSTPFIIEDGVCKLEDRSAFAGSIATADRLVRVAVKEAGIPLLDAVRMITANPARLMGLPYKGQIAPHADADLVIFDDEICVKAVFARGVRIPTED